jgi:hypothetical protein
MNERRYLTADRCINKNGKIAGMETAYLMRRLLSLMLKENI